MSLLAILAVYVALGEFQTPSQRPDRYEVIYITRANPTPVARSPYRLRGSTLVYGNVPKQPCELDTLRATLTEAVVPGGTALRLRYWYGDSAWVSNPVIANAGVALEPWMCLAPVQLDGPAIAYPVPNDLKPAVLVAQFTYQAGFEIVFGQDNPCWSGLGPLEPHRVVNAAPRPWCSDSCEVVCR